jgi:vanillate/4-hydroxybenzoate decarboxylase subunit C
VIVVDEDVDPFNLNQVMWAISVRANPAGDVVIIPNLAENLLDPAGEPNGMSHKMILDATTPKAPDRRGDYGEVLDTPEQTDAWRNKLLPLIKALKK